jgi:hypothetical protein
MHSFRACKSRAPDSDGTAPSADGVNVADDDDDDGGDGGEGGWREEGGGRGEGRRVNGAIAARLRRGVLPALNRGHRSSVSLTFSQTIIPGCILDNHSRHMRR